MIPSKLVHDTGTMIRFRTSQLPLLPNGSSDVQLLLPNGGIVDGRFTRNQNNPNVSGADLVRYIKRRISFGEREDVLVELRRPRLWVVHLLRQSTAVATSAGIPAHRIRNATLGSVDLATLLDFADRENQRGRRLETYKRVLRPSGLRRLVLAVMGPVCMVDGCDACNRFDTEWGGGSGDAITEVHHIEHVARTIDHHPRNLCVLCGNHHRFVHNSGAWHVRHDGSNVVFQRDGRDMVIVRPPALFPSL